jgi:hypothetical protein
MSLHLETDLLHHKLLYKETAQGTYNAGAINDSELRLKRKNTRFTSKTFHREACMQQSPAP